MPRRFVEGYAKRLSEPRVGGPRDLVSHAVVQDPPASAAEPWLALLDRLVEQLEGSMPHRTGDLRLPRFHTLRAVLEATVGGGASTGRSEQLAEALYPQLLRRRPVLGLCAKVAGYAPGAPTVQQRGLWSTVVLLLPVLFPMLVYRLFLSTPWSARRAGTQRPRGRTFLRMAAAVAADGTERNNHELIQRMLLAALLQDLAAARPTLRWGRRLLRPRLFVLLLPTVGGEDTPVHQFLVAYDNVVRHDRAGRETTPLLVLGAVAGEPPSFAERCPSEAGETAAHQVEAVCLRHSSPICLVSLPSGTDDGPARTFLRTKPAVRMAFPWRRLVLASAVPLAPAVAAAVVLLGEGFHEKPQPVAAVEPPSCFSAPGSAEPGKTETIGITDGSCELASPGRDPDLPLLEDKLRRQNAAALASGRPWRSVVFFGPLTTEPGDSTPVSVQTLRGALTAQYYQNRREGDTVQIRLLVANAGKNFVFGEEIARKIVERRKQDSIVAVTGITQSRPVSAAAVRLLSAAHIPVVGSNVTGSKMLENPALGYYFQVSPHNGVIAPFMAAFIRGSAELRELAGPSRKAVVVYDPDDEYFSIDLKTKLERHVRPAATVPYYEHRNDQDVRDVAQDVCAAVRRTGGFIAYLGRTGVMPRLFDQLEEAPDCRNPDGKPVAIVAESVATRYLEEPAAFLETHPHLRMFYVMFDAADAGFGSDRILQQTFTALFPGSTAEGNAAGGYDSLRIVSTAMDSVYSSDKSLEETPERFQSPQLYSTLAKPGITIVGTSGSLTLDADNHSPPDRVMFMLELTLEARPRLWMTCGNLSTPVGPRPPAPAQKIPCPKSVS
ncbi:hypothetical protein [Actinocorallia longicatena]|uniref:ABC-type branched-subunit amino acid transport system substrate-binding protein n=1 Tax=Actinocorallia longicatena TaxID=111803 RepID=A0ABP6QLM4_9ACTN